MRPRAALAFVLVACLLPGGFSSARATTAPEPTIGPLVSGTGHYVNGTYVWTDYAYDDTLGSYTAGESNAADLIQLQLSLAPSDDLAIRAVYETLTPSSASTVCLVVALDSDDDVNTGSSVPGFALGAPPRGTDVSITVTAQRTIVSHWNGTDFTSDIVATTAVDPDANIIDATVPAAQLETASPAWRVYGWTMDGSHAQDLAFVGGESPSGWQSARQSQVKNGTVVPEEAAVLLDLDAMRAGVTTGVDASSPGFHTFLYRSQLKLAEGIRQWNLTGPNGTPLPLGNFYAGPYQPYIVWIPSRPLPEHPPLVVYMHGLEGTHTSNVNTLGDGKIDPDAIVVMPLGRGEDSFYEREGEQDILDVTDDALARFGADPDRVVLSGISMGGFGAFRLGILRPDRWSAIVPLIGTSNSAQFYFGPAASPGLFSPSEFPSGAGEMIENLENVPVRMVNGQVDPIVNNAFVTADTAALHLHAIDYRSWVLLHRQHEVVPALTDCIFDEAVARRRADPARVVFATEPSTYVHDDSTGLDLRYRGAYWVGNVVARDGASIAKVDATNLRRSDRKPDAVDRVAILGDNLHEPLDLCGNARTQTQDQWRETGHIRSEGAAQPASNGFELLLTNVGSLDIDLSQTHHAVTEPLTLAIGGDGSTTLQLRGGWSGPVKITRDGVDFATVAPHDGIVKFTDDISTVFARQGIVAVGSLPRTYTIAPA